MAYKQNNPLTDPPAKSSSIYDDDDKYNAALATRKAARQAYENERSRVKKIVKNIDTVAEQAIEGKYTVNFGPESDKRVDVLGAGVVPQATYNWLENAGGAACSTYACGIMREAGVTVPNSVGEDGITINNVTYNAGDKMPIIPGNAQFDAVAPMLGFELRPGGSYPEEGDITRSSYYTGTTHSTVQVGGGESVYNPGYPNRGLKKGEYYSTPSNFDALSDKDAKQLQKDLVFYGGQEAKVDKDGKIYPDRLMRYVGDLPKLTKELRAANKPFDTAVSRIKPKGIQITQKPTASILMPTNVSKFFNRNK